VFDKKIKPFVHTQFGTLGSGNHFLEIGVNSAGNVGVTVHSGSRRVGYKIASWYMKKGSLLPLDGDLGRAYLADMNWALDFALANRREMMRRTLETMKVRQVNKLTSQEVMVNENHNHAVPSGRKMTLHRKGATPAETGRLGIIPANQRDGVWVTRGLGNEEFLSSASHGAGRKLSRTEARGAGTVSELEKNMKGVICRTDKGILDEAPWVYKNIGDVLSAQEGILVEVVDHFKPVIVLKG
jgi:tRNA-splicing ligase RtcB